MKKWKLISVFVLCIMLIGITQKEVKAAEKTITIDGEWLSDSVTDDVCFYKFTIPFSGTVTYAFQSYASGGGARLYNEDLTTSYSDVYCSGTPNNPETEEAGNILEQGTYVLKVCDYWGDDNWTGSYRLKVSFKPAGNNETEPNGSFDKAMPLGKNKKVTGLISEDDGVDFYKVTLSSPQIMNVIFRFDNNFYFSVWDSELLEVKNDWYYAGSHEWEQYLQKGTYYIKVESDGESTGTYSLKWESKQYVSSIKLKKSKLTLSKGQKYKLLSAVKPGNATDKSLSWESSDTSVATVSPAGKVTAKSPGVATITATSQDGSNISSSCVVIVKPQKAKISRLKYNISWGSVEGQKINVQLRSQSGVYGYQVMYSTDKNFKKYNKFRSYYTSAVTKQLKKGKKYYFRARAFYMYEDKYYYGPWSDVRSITTKRK